MPKKYSLFIGRWQCIPPHQGHIALVETVLKEGKNALIAIRDTKVDKDNPFSIEQRRKALKKAFKKWGRKVKVTKVPNIEEVCWGRGVEWGRREIRLDDEMESISATKIRNQMRK